MRKFKWLSFIFLSITLLGATSCGDEDVKSFDPSKLEGIWTQVFDSRIQDVSVVKYVFTGKEHDGQTKIYIECDIHRLTKNEMVWYKTDSQEEIARFKKDTKIDNN